MSEISAEDILVAARRVGWTVAAERAAQIAAIAGPAIRKFADARATLDFDTDAQSLGPARERVKDRDQSR